jgi:hypothetical protein
MRRIVHTLIPLLALLALALPVPARAEVEWCKNCKSQVVTAGAEISPTEVEWCKKDPVVRLNGTQLQVWVAIPAQYQPLVTGPVRVAVNTPEGVARELVSTDEGFNGYGEAVTFGDIKGSIRYRAFPTEIRVSVPIDGSRLAPGEVVPVRVEIIPDNAPAMGVRGTSDRTTARLIVIGKY